MPLLGLLVLFLIGALVTAPAIEREVGQGVGRTLAGAGVSVQALTADGQGVTARIGEAGLATSILEPLAEATMCNTWVGELRCPVAVSLHQDGKERVAPEDAYGAEEIDVQEQTRRVRQTCNEALQDALSDTSIQFRTASAIIDAGNDALLQRLASLARDCPGTLAVEGHTDSLGDADMNAALSQARADAVRLALAALGVDSARVRAVGYGESRPIANNSTAEGRAANRRIVISIDEPE